MFKRANGAPRVGRKNASGPSFAVPPVSGYEACLARGHQPTPATCEGGPDEDSNLGPVLEADYAGHDFEHDYAHAKAVPEGADPAAFDACLEDVMAAIEDGDIVPEDPEADPKETAYALCSAGGACKGAHAMKAEEVVEFPAPPSQCDRDQCMAIATDIGLSEEQAEQAYDAVQKQFGAPWEDPDLILVPKDLEPQDLVTEAAKSLGFIAEKGIPKVKFTGRSHWADGIRSFLGLKSQSPATKALVSEIKRQRQIMEGLVADQTKTKEDLKEVLHHVIAQQAADRRLFARAMGIDPADIEAPAPSAPAAIAEPAPIGKRAVRKDAPPAPTAAVAEPEAPQSGELEARMDRFEAALVEQGTVLQQIVGALGGAESQAPQPAKRMSRPLAPAPARRFGATKAAAGGERFVSSLTGIETSKAERDAVWANQGIQTLARK